MKRWLLGLRRLFRLIPIILGYVEHLDALWPKLEQLLDILDRLESINSRITEMDVLYASAAVSRLESLDVSVKKIEKIAAAKTHNGVPEVAEERHEIKRAAILSKFAQLSGKAREIELEWQRIQQDEHDAQTAFQTSFRGDAKDDHLYKKGIVKGIEWCVNRFS